MSFMIWHRIEIAKHGGGGSAGFGAAVASALGFGLPLRISNDVYTLGLTLDAEVTVTMAEGAVADGFVITVYDLPEKDVALLKAGYPNGGLTATINLGYFDSPALLLGGHPVMRGRVTRVAHSVTDDGRAKTEITGSEEAGYVLLRRKAAAGLAGRGQLDDLVRALLAKDDVGDTIPLAKGSTLGVAAKDVTIRAVSALGALAQLTEAADVPMLVRDGVVYLGPAVGTQTAPVGFDPDTNLVSQEESQDEPPAPVTTAAGAGSGAGAASGGGRPGAVTTMKVVVLGHPGLRVGQLVRVSGLAAGPSGPLRIANLVHTYGGKKGYTCTVTLVDTPAGRRAPASTGPAAVVDQWNKAIVDARINNPAIDVGEVTAYTAGGEGDPERAHRVSMHYAQVPEKGVGSPSIASTVDTTVDLTARPIAAPFAFHNVGLMTPVYPGMRALLAHNRSLPNDAVVAGWLWPTTPASTPPPNEPGDWWLALPTGLGADGRPTGKGVNDLVDARGARTIHARALHIVVGHGKLIDVGTRPRAPKDDTVTIEHAAGTTITIADDGAVSITTRGRPITIGNGSVSMKLDDATVAVS